MRSAVFDSNIILQGILSPNGPAGACIQLLSETRFKLVATQATLLEIQSVVTRPKLVAKYQQLRGERPESVLSKIRENAIIVDEPKRVFRFERDPADEVFINLALEANADYLVSRDYDLLDLRYDSAFISSFPDLKIVSPFEFLQAVRTK